MYLYSTQMMAEEDIPEDEPTPSSSPDFDSLDPQLQVCVLANVGRPVAGAYLVWCERDRWRETGIQ